MIQGNRIENVPSSKKVTGSCHHSIPPLQLRAWLTGAARFSSAAGGKEVSAWGEEKLSRFLTPAAVGPLNLNSQSHKYLKVLGYKPQAEFPLSSEAEKPELESKNTNCCRSDFKPQSSTGGPGKC